MIKDPIPSSEISQTFVFSSVPATNQPQSQEIDDFLPTERTRIVPQPSTSGTRSASRKAAAVVKRDWAHVVDVNKGLPNFKELVPDMAHKVLPSAFITSLPKARASFPLMLAVSPFPTSYYRLLT